MIVCVQCRTEMRCIKNSVGADFGSGHVYPADKFGCPKCSMEVLVCNKAPSYDPDYKFQNQYISMRQNSKDETTV